MVIKLHICIEGAKQQQKLHEYLEAQYFVASEAKKIQKLLIDGTKIAFDLLFSCTKTKIEERKKILLMKFFSCFPST